MRLENFGVSQEHIDRVGGKRPIQLVSSTAGSRQGQLPVVSEPK
ncbi:hypothetical protein NY08_692 [Rhodococcus sp. B7740]|nr:hypothetical protein NY08_692 [Rhodococcus sp. B7740]